MRPKLPPGRRRPKFPPFPPSRGPYLLSLAGEFLSDPRPTVLGAIDGLLFFRIFLGFVLEGWQAPSDSPFPVLPDYFKLYILGWVLFPAAGFLWAGCREGLRRKWAIPAPDYYPLFFFLNFTLLLLFLHPSGLDSDRWPSLLGIFLVFQTAGFAILRLRQSGRKSPAKKWNPDLPYFWALLPLAFWLWSLPVGWWKAASGQPAYSWLFFAGAAWLFHRAIPSPTSPGDREGVAASLSLGWRILPGFFVLLLLAYLVTDPEFRHDLHHLPFYLGPLADLLGGKSLLANINSQYGVLVFYFLDPFFHFLPLGPTSFVLVGSLLTVLQYWLFYFIARRLFHSEALALFVLGAFLLLNHFLPQAEFPEYYPSTGPLRFGFFYAFSALVLLRNGRPQRWKGFYVLEAAVAAAAFFWGIEVCVYTVPAYLALVVYESMGLEKGRLRFEGKGFRTRLTAFLGSVLGVALFLYLDVFRRTHQWPDWSGYLDQVSSYKNGLGGLPIPAFGAWWLVAGMLYLSLVLLLCFFPREPGKNRLEDLNAAAFLTFYGATQFLYFIGRAHPLNLAHICAPALLLLVYWPYHLRRRPSPFFPQALQKGVFTGAAAFAAWGLSLTLPTAVKVVQQRALPLPAFLDHVVLAARDLPRDDAFAKEAQALMERFSKGQKFIVYFFGNRDLDISLYAGRREAYPYNDIVQADAFPLIHRRILAFDPGLKPGDCIYFSEDLKEAVYYLEYAGLYRKVQASLEGQLLSKLQEKYLFKPVARDSISGITVYQVAALRR